MNVTLLISAIVRQTTVLIAELATSGGLRAPLAHVADQVFLELGRELEAQGVSRKVSADMFGMALRTYQRKVHRLQESVTERGQTLWEAVHAFIGGREVVSRRQVLERFRLDDEVVVRGVLTDLVDGGFVFATGPALDTSFRAASDAEIGAMARDRAPSDELLWALVFRTGPLTVTALAALSRWKPEELEAALARLVKDGRVRREESGSEPLYHAERLVLPLDGRPVWEAAVYDHYHAVVRTICAKLRRGSEGAPADDTEGGSTYSFEVWPGHPLEAKVIGTLRRFREEMSALRGHVRDHNAVHAKPPVRTGVVIYGGQTTWEVDDADDD
jgi:hypothetical protein